MQMALRQVSSINLPITRSRVLVGYRTGTVTLAVNGRVGRRTACVLDERGLKLETFDLESGDEMDVEEDDND
jgi:anaphase-promoting complex subunit 4